MFKKLTDSLQGRTTFFLVLFFIAGMILQIFHRLDANFIGFFTVFMTAVIGHSIKEDLAPSQEPPPVTPEKPKPDASTA